MKLRLEQRADSLSAAYAFGSPKFDLIVWLNHYIP